MDEHKQIRDLLTIAASGALSADERRRVESHLAGCPACRSELAGLTRLTAVLQKQPAPAAPHSLVENTRRMLELRAQQRRERRQLHWLLAALTVLGWALTFLTWPLLRLFDRPLADWFHLSQLQLTFLWTSYFLAGWMATALAAAFLGGRVQRQERTL